MTKEINNQQIAIDGPAGSGKSTVAKLVAERLGFDYLSTGKMYRTFYYLIKQNDWSIDQLVSNFKNYEHLFNGDQVVINKQNISDLLNEPVISKGASDIAQDAKIRQLALNLQQDYAAKNPVVMDGRDVTSVVLPNAILKVFLTASARERAIRRIKQLNLELNEPTIEQFTNEIKLRDDNDTNRKLAPLMIVEDAIVIDSDSLSIEQVVDKIVGLYQQKLGDNHA
ncbi:(d)CMP kinase [Mycoplasma tullyi]|uniref:Cytidylate kinase n=1 Tax=Mycoplasma tullyi TaxID=1612150 RepID=A0A7D7UAJ8_9MOLU|nr:(d)CMP kinase [Mycoplasma tullyi]QMT98664.1 (d)CMP kinase [Mycoplasma tullyi]